MNNRPFTRKRKGTVAVEFAMTAPLYFLVLFAGIELSRANMILHTCENAAFEGARLGIVPGASADDCYQEANAILSIVGISDSTVTVEPAVITDDTTSVTVNVQVPLTAANGYVTPRFVLGEVINKSITLQRETN